MTAALDAIRALAEAATPGPWRLKDRGPAHDFDNHHYVVADTRREPITDMAVARGYYHDAAYIAAVDPQTVLGILAALDRAEAVVAAAKVVTDPMVEDGGGDRWWNAHDALRAALRAYDDADKVADG